jgi:hypothetical protein
VLGFEERYAWPLQVEQEIARGVKILVGEQQQQQQQEGSLNPQPNVRPL